MLHTAILLGIVFDAEDGDDMFLPNICSLATYYTALYSRRWNSV
jgi:hypothetical protein